ncbi:class C sortase [Clostridium sp. Sa3CUN1]|uniref:Class C sortase n=1 Tax=Clostridium gallinarum TaxID=2762246 RepID=A0ABR8Q5Z4_9CLOT|nr:class C sortase [Clostridium gallinarum]MBD7915858.1 class C sortase [Clostridium gallinarum]
MGKNDILKKLSFLFGLILCSYPLISGIVQQQAQKGTVATYQQMIESSSSSSLEEALTKAIEYNEILFESFTSLSSDKLSILSEESYNEILNMGNGIMGSIEIPSINVNLPIYHGTSDEVLSAGVGHLNGSSLPIGGLNTKSILTAHRGLPSSKLFTRLDELVEGDLFFINVLGETLAYKINDIQVIDPEDVSGLEIEEGKDLVSLITCTPYGLNTHRLVVTGERTEYEPAIYENIATKNMSIREYVFLAIPIIFVSIVVGRRIKSARKKA